MSDFATNWLVEYEAELQRQKDALPARKAAILATLKTAGIAVVVIEYDGEGDSGQIDMISACDAAGEHCIPRSGLLAATPARDDYWRPAAHAAPFAVTAFGDVASTASVAMTAKATNSGTSRIRICYVLRNFAACERRLPEPQMKASKHDRGRFPRHAIGEAAPASRMKVRRGN